ncbi:MAG: peptidoglycan bridge formation glycyltransferase FemA/FemB family protein [Solobacterium sp.]|nr:peptidoglycan bridge formation glycyltransferase FemA/FemB family protein [Solobacterium sp.]
MTDYRFVENIDSGQFDRFVRESDQNSLFQNSRWPLIKTNWKGILTGVFDEENNLCAAALILIRNVAAGKTMMYIPRGPVLDYRNDELLSFTIKELKALAKKHHAMVLRFDPALMYRRYAYKDRNDEHETMNEDIITRLQSLGAQHRGFTTNIIESTQPRYNAEMDVEPDYFDHLEHKTAKCVRQAEHKGLKIKEGPEYVPLFSEMMHHTEVRKKVALRNEEYFRNFMSVYGDQAICMITVIDFPEQIAALEKGIAENEEKLNGELPKKQKNVLKQDIERDRKELERLRADYERCGKEEDVTCGIIAWYNEGLMELLYMGNHPDYMRFYGSYLLYKTCMDRCVELGIKRCSFGGIEGTLDDGLTLFKSNWLMNVEEYIGEFNIVLSPLVYWAFDKVYPVLLNAAAKKRGSE